MTAQEAKELYIKTKAEKEKVLEEKACVQLGKIYSYIESYIRTGSQQGFLVFNNTDIPDNVSSMIVKQLKDDGYNIDINSDRSGRAEYKVSGWI